MTNLLFHPLLSTADLRNFLFLQEKPKPQKAKKKAKSVPLGPTSIEKEPQIAEVNICPKGGTQYKCVLIREQGFCLEVSH